MVCFLACLSWLQLCSTEAMCERRQQDTHVLCHASDVPAARSTALRTASTKRNRPLRQPLNLGCSTTPGLHGICRLLPTGAALHCPLVSAAGIELHHEDVLTACVHIAIQGAGRVACHIHVPVRVHLCRRVLAVLFGLATRVRGVLPGTLPEIAISARCLPPSSALSFLSHAFLKTWWIEFLHMPCSASHTQRPGSQGQGKATEEPI